MKIFSLDIKGRKENSSNELINVEGNKFSQLGIKASAIFIDTFYELAKYLLSKYVKNVDEIFNELFSK